MLGFFSTRTLRRVDRVLSTRGIFLSWRIAIAQELWFRYSADYLADAAREGMPW